jgi:hypothetical protein
MQNQMTFNASRQSTGGEVKATQTIRRRTPCKEDYPKNKYIHKYIHHTYIHTYIHICIHTYITTYTHILTYIPTYIIQTYIHTYIHTYPHKYPYTYTHTYKHMHTHTYIHTYIHKYTCTHTCIHTYICAHKHVRGLTLLKTHLLFRYVLGRRSGCYGRDRQRSHQHFSSICRAHAANPCSSSLTFAPSLPFCTPSPCRPLQ